jgi:two-component system chemotaxis response regulator CheY
MPSCLVVDDSKVVRKLERRIMEELNFTVFEAEDGQKAAEFCAMPNPDAPNMPNMPDLILLDWHMPVMNGLEFLKVLRAMPDGDIPKVIFCTTESEMSNIIQALELGANEYIMKPFDSEIVKDKLEQVGIIV